MDKAEAIARSLVAEYGHDQEELIAAIAKALHLTIKEETLHWDYEEEFPIDEKISPFPIKQELDGYEVWMTQGQGGGPIDKFDALEEALAYAEKGIKNKEGSFAIKYPTGEWHQWKT